MGRGDLRPQERRDYGGRVRTTAHRERPRPNRTALADPVPSLPRSRRRHPNVGHQRYRNRAVGHQGQGSWSANLRASRRPDARAYLVLRQVGWPDSRASRRDRDEFRRSGDHRTQRRPLRTSGPVHPHRGRKAGHREDGSRPRGGRRRCGTAGRGAWTIGPIGGHSHRQ